MTPLAQALNTALLHFIWQGIAIGLLLWIALFLLRGRSANARYVASCVALLLLALAPVVTAWDAYLPLEPQVSWKSFTYILQAPGFGPSASASAGFVPGVRSFEQWILPAWAIGVALFALRLMWCWGHTSALRRTGTPADDTFLAMVSRAAGRIGVTRSVRVLMSSVAEVPSVIGWIRPVLLLPVAVAAGLTPEQLEAVIAHELAHIRRHDYLVNLAQVVAETVLFYHPIVWWVSSKIRYERELCCDDLAVTAVGNAASYARALARLEEVRGFRPSLAMGAANGPLFQRIERLLGGDGSKEGPSRLACAVALLIGTVCFALNMGWAEGLQSIQSRNNGYIVQGYFPPLAPLPMKFGMRPMPALPALPVLPTLPSLPSPPPLPPLPPVYAKVSPPLAAAVERFVQSADVAWILFRKDSVIARASSADEADARSARESAGSGDALWFRLDGKAYLTQEKTILDRFAEADLGRAPTAVQIPNIPIPGSQIGRDVSIAVTQLEMSKARIATAEMARMLAEQRYVAEQKKFEFGTSVMRFVLEEQRNLEQTQSSEIAAKLDYAKALADYERAVGRFVSQIPDLLHDAVSSGKARPVQ